jgi:hypothetical protein
LNSRHLALCCWAHVSASRHAASPSHTQLLLTRLHYRQVPPVSRCAHVAHACRLPCSQRAHHARATCAARCCPSGPEPPHPCRASSRGAAPLPPPLSAPSPTPTRHRVDPHPSHASSRLCSKGSHPTPPHSPLFFSPSLSSAHGQASRLSSTPATEPPRPSPAHFRPPPSPPPHGETHQSTTISNFGAALTSLVLPHSSRS